MSARRSSLAALAFVASCASPQAVPTPAATPTSTPAASAPSPTASAPPGALRFIVVPERSRATIRVREQVAGIAAPGDAVLTTEAFSGSFVLLPDGSFTRGSTIAAELDTLKSDQTLRDEWIKINTLQTRLYPRAEFSASRLSGVPLPLPSTGEWTATLEGTMRIHGVERSLTWELRAARSAGEVRVQGSTSFRFGDYGMAVPANRLVLSVVDDVRLEVLIVAREA